MTTEAPDPFVDGPPTAIRAQVSAFHDLFNAPAPDHPKFPDYDRFQLRLRLITEEFFELLAACNKNNPDQESVKDWMQEAHDVVHALRDTAPENADMVDVVDALADLDYVIEGTRLELGVNGGPIADIVHAANMAKVSGGVRGDGKILKPEGWTPPDIAGELRRQGWEG